MFKVVPEVPKLLFIFWILSSFCSSCMFISSFCSKELIWVPVSFLSLLVPWIFYCISLWVVFICPFILRQSSVSSVSILITRAFNSLSDRLAICSSLSSLSGVLLCSFAWAIFLCFGAPVWLVWLTVSLIPLLSEFHAGWFCGTSGCLLILDWLLSSFWLCEEVKGFHLWSHLGRNLRESDFVFLKLGP